MSANDSSKEALSDTMMSLKSQERWNRYSEGVQRALCNVLTGILLKQRHVGVPRKDIRMRPAVVLPFPASMHVWRVSNQSLLEAIRTAGTSAGAVSLK